jgi:ABC-2 type transport system permease protein
VSFGALLGSELARLRARRAVHAVFGAAVVLTAIVVVVAAIRSTGTGPADHTMRLRTLWLEGRDAVSETTVLSVAVYLMLFGAALAATAVGGDYRAGTVGTPLTWEPRRVRLVVARLAAIAVVVAALYVVVMGVLVGGWWLGSTLRGTVAVPDRFWGDLVAVIARCGTGTVGIALVTAGIVLVTRSTVGGIIVWFGYLVGVEGVLANNISGLRGHLLVANLGAFLTAQSERYTDGPSGGVVRVGPSDGILLLVLVVVVAVGLGGAAFARRDVT